MTVIWSGVTEEGAVVPVQVDGAGRVVATTGEPPEPPVIEYSGASAWGNVSKDGTLQGGLNVSVLRSGVGSYEVTFQTPMPNANYSLVFGNVADGSAKCYAINEQSRTVSGFAYVTLNSIISPEDFGSSFAVFSLNASPPKGGTGTDAWLTCSSNGELGNSFNVASVAKAQSPAGQYQVTFATPMPTADYSVQATISFGYGFINVFNETTTGFQIQCRGESGVETDIAFQASVNASNAVLPVTVTAEQLYAVTNNWYLSGEDILTTRYKVEMQEGIKFAGGKAGITRDGELYFTSNGGKYVIAVNDEQIGLTRIDSAY